MNSSPMFYQRNFIRNIYGIFRKSESLQNLSPSLDQDFREYHVQPRQEEITVPLSIKRSGSIDSLNRYNNPVIKYYQERKRFFNSNMEERASEVVERRSFIGLDPSAIKNNLKIIGKIPFKDTISQKEEEDDNLSLNNAIVECKESCKSIEPPPPNIHVAEKQPVLQKKYYMEPYKRKMDADGSCYNLDDDTRSLTLSIREAMSKKRDPSSGPYRVTLMKNPDDDCKSLCLSISTANGVEPMEKRILRPVQSNANKKIMDKIKKNRLKKISLSEGDLFTKLKRMSSKHRDGDQITVATSYNNINSNSNQTPTTNTIITTKRLTTKQFLKQIPLPEVQPQKTPFIAPSSRKKEKPKTYPWSCNVQRKTPYMGYGISPRSVTNITQHLMSKKSGTTIGDIKRKKSSANLAQAATTTNQLKKHDAKKEEKSKFLSPKNFINKIMSMYKRDKTT